MAEKQKKRFPKGALPPVGQGGQVGQVGSLQSTVFSRQPFLLRAKRMSGSAGGMVQMSTDKYEAACGGEKVFKTIPAAWEQMAAAPLSPPQMS